MRLKLVCTAFAFALAPFAASADIVLSTGQTATSQLSFSGVQEQLFSVCPPGFPGAPPCTPVPIGTRPLAGPYPIVRVRIVSGPDARDIVNGAILFSLRNAAGTEFARQTAIITTQPPSGPGPQRFAFDFSTPTFGVIDFARPVTVTLSALSGSFPIESFSIMGFDFTSAFGDEVRLTSSPTTDFAPAVVPEGPGVAILGLAFALATAHLRRTGFTSRNA